jgi:hypothetical protein
MKILNSTRFEFGLKVATPIISNQVESESGWLKKGCNPQQH